MVDYSGAKKRASIFIGRNNRISFSVSFWLIVILTVLYRFILLKKYFSLYLDEDQALLWYGTVLASNFGIEEPHFLGQAYGSMLESILSVPTYIFGLKLSWALPLTTAILWYLPFYLTSIFLKTRNRVFSLLVLVIPLIQNWNYDILVGLPRSFIPGFLPATIGILLLLIKDGRTGFNFFLSPVLLAVAYVNTENTITIITLMALYIILYERKTIRNNIKSLLLGIIAGLFICWYCNYYFYRVNDEFILHKGMASLSFSWQVFNTNIEHNLTNLMSSFSVISIKGIPLVLYFFFILIIFLSLFFKEWKFLLILISAICGTLLFLSVPKSLDFYDELLFSQARMFLFVPYILMEMILFAGLILCKKKICLSYRAEHFMFIVIFILCFGLSVGKIHYFNNRVLSKPCLYHSKVIATSRTREVEDMAEEISKLATKNSCKIVVMLSDSRLVGYATGAINYNQYVSYNAFYDRRTSTYLKLKKEPISENVLFVECQGSTVVNSECIYIEDNLIIWLQENKGKTRYPN